MGDMDEVLRSLAVFSELSDDERAFVTEEATDRRLDAGEVVYHEGEVGDRTYVVVDGAVELILAVGDMETTGLTVRNGGLFGALSWLDGGPRPVTARACEPTRVLEFDASSMGRLRERSPAAAASVLQFLAARLAEATRTIAARFQSVLRWNLDVSGASTLGIDRLVTDRVEVTVDLMTGTRVCGTLLKVEQSVAGHEIVLKTEEGEIAIVPYHAIARAVFPQGNLLTADEPNGEVRDG